MGGKGEEFTGTIIKDTWTITMGVETGEGGREGGGSGEGWWEKAENYLNNNFKKLKEKAVLSHEKTRGNFNLNACY